MNKIVKKIIMTVILVVFMGVIAIVMININDKSVKKINKSSNTSSVNNTNNLKENTNGVNSEIIRKNTKKVTANTNNMVEIGDSYFIQATNDVYINLDDYVGKTIKIQGLIYSYEDYNGEICYAVVRNTPGCCGTDGLAGLDIRYDGEYPEENTWVTIIGVIGTDIVFGSKVPAIQVTSLEKTKAGTTFVSN